MLKTHKVGNFIYSPTNPLKFFIYAAIVMGLMAIYFVFTAQSVYAGGETYIYTTDEVATAAGSIKVWMRCTGGDLTEVGSTSATGTLEFLPPVAASCGEGDTVDQVVLERDGLVTSNTSPGTTFVTSTGTGFTSIGTIAMLFQFKIILTDQLGTAVMATTMDTLTFGGVAASSTSVGTAYFGNSGSSATLIANEAGYRTATTTNTGLTDITTSSSTQLIITFASSTAASSAITTTTTVKGLEFGQKLVVSREGDSQNLAGATTVTAGSGDTTCTEEGTSNTGVYFCAVPIAQDGGTDDVAITHLNYVKHTGGDTGDRNIDNDAQQTVSVTDVQFSYKLTLYSGSNEVNSATVTAGDNYGTTCVEGSGDYTSIYYCPVPSANTHLYVKAEKEGFETWTGTFGSDRTAPTNAQVTLVTNGVKRSEAASSGTDAVSVPTITKIVAGDSTGKTTDRDIMVTITGSNILRYKIAESSAALDKLDWLRYGDKPVSFKLSEGLGVKTLYLKFYSWDGGESAVKTAKITLMAAPKVEEPVKETPTEETPVEIPVEEEAPAVEKPISTDSYSGGVPTVLTPVYTAPIAADLTPKSIAVLEDGDLFMIEDATVGASVYWYTGGKKRPIPNEKTFLSWFPSFERVAIKRVKRDEIGNLPWGSSIPYKPGSRLIKVPDDPKVYAIQDNGTVAHVPSEERAIELYGADWASLVDDMPVSVFLGTYDIDVNKVL